MSAEDVRRYIRDTFDGIHVIDHEGDTYVIYDPDRDLPPERQMPFATIITGDRHDTASALDRPGAYRLNVGLTKATYTGLFGAPPTARDESGVLVTGFDYTAADALMPHPVYASQHWVCAVNPGEATWARLRELLDEAHAFAARKYGNYRARRVAVAGLRVEAVTEATAEDWRRVHNEIIPTAPLSADEVRERIGRNRLEVAYRDGVLVGNFTVRPPVDGTATVIVRVLPGARRQGIGEELHERATTLARNLGASVLETIVLASNVDGLRFAGRHGYVEVERYLVDGDEIPFVTLRLDG